MTNCEICGKREAAAVALIEGARMSVCTSCSRYGKIVHRLRDDEEPEAPVQSSAPRALQETDEIVEDYAELIRKKREELSLPREVLAEKINEKESYIEKIEKGRLTPTISVARKLEKELGIKLVEKIKPRVAATFQDKEKFKEPTLADMLDSQKKGK